MTLIQLMLASEELDRLTVDHGAKIDDLDLRTAMRSFDELDAARKQKSENRLSDIKQLVARRTGADEDRLAAKFELHGKTVLQTSSSRLPGLKACASRWTRTPGCP